MRAILVGTIAVVLRDALRSSKTASSTPLTHWHGQKAGRLFISTRIDQFALSIHIETMATSNLHALLLLSDSALPLGSFAFSSGLESFLAHHKKHHTSATSRLAAFDAFLGQSVANVASTALPYVLTAYEQPNQLEDLDNDFDASTPCTVARRASIAQGRALVGIWEKALLASLPRSQTPSKAREALQAFSASLKSKPPSTQTLGINTHFAPLFGAVCAALDLSTHETAYLFLLNHAKAVLSAAVRASVMGPYQSQAVLASGKLQTCINASIDREKSRKVEDAAVTVPTMDLWMGRHELLYSRIFNS